jgi:hypothetical protein
MESKEHSYQGRLTVSQAQEVIYGFLLELVKTCSPDQVLEEFRHLFIQHHESSGSDTIPALHIILFANDEAEFRNTIKRSCYILVNNWEVARRYDAMQSLVDLFADPLLYRPTYSPTLKRLRQWLLRFVESQDFQDLKLFAARYAEERTMNRPGEWTNRYATYLLVPQYIDTANPIEQRRAARALSRRLKDKFKFDLAMYTAYSQAPSRHRRKVQNPTALGDSALRLIKAIVAKRGEFSYRNLANLFLEQVKGSSYSYFKRSLPFYLLYTVRANPITEQVQDQLAARLANLYSDYDQQMLDNSLILRTCNRMIDCLMTEDRESPAQLFSLVLSQGNALTLAVILLKLVLIAPGSKLYLEVRIADLIRYYEQFPKDQCQWVINFLEIFRVTFAIYAENIEYNLIKVSNGNAFSLDQVGHLSTQSGSAQNGNGTGQGEDIEDWDAFRIFSQMLYYPMPDNTLDLPQE